MQFDPSKVTLVAGDQNTVEMLRIVFRKALGKPVDELVINKLVAVLDGNIKVDPSILKKKEKKKPEKKEKTEAKPETAAADPGEKTNERKD